MKEFNDLKGIVSIILHDSEEARNDDTTLYIMVCEKMNAEACKRPFKEVLKHRHDFGLPKFESVSRVRRKLQESNEEIQSSKAVMDLKFEKFKKVKDWAINE